MKILIFGGTFDPPHNGHLALLKGAVLAVQPDLTLVIPAGIPPHKAAAHSSAKARAAMCRRMVRGLPRVKIDLTEIRRGGKSYTSDTLRTLQKRYRGAQLYFCMGSDMLLYFEKWHEWRQILSMATLVVQSRSPQDEQICRDYAQTLRGCGARIIFTCAPLYQASSTQMREAAANGKSVAPCMPSAVRAFVRKKNLYSRKEAAQ